MIERLAPLLVSFMSRDFGQKLRRVRRNGLLYLACGLLALTAYGAGVAGVVLVLANAYGAVAALFALAIAALSLAVAALAAVLMCNRNDRTLAAASPVGGGGRCWASRRRPFCRCSCGRALSPARRSWRPSRFSRSVSARTATTIRRRRRKAVGFGRTRRLVFSGICSGGDFPAQLVEDDGHVPCRRRRGLCPLALLSNEKRRPRRGAVFLWRGRTRAGSERGDQTSSSRRRGSSISSLMRTRNVTASLPSMMR